MWEPAPHPFGKFPTLYRFSDLIDSLSNLKEDRLLINNIIQKQTTLEIKFSLEGSRLDQMPEVRYSGLCNFRLPWGDLPRHERCQKYKRFGNVINFFVFLVTLDSLVCPVINVAKISKELVTFPNHLYYLQRSCTKNLATFLCPDECSCSQVQPSRLKLCLVATAIVLLCLDTL